VSEMWIPLELEDCDANPFIQFRRWFDEAKGEMLERDAISVATSTPDGKPSTRMVCFVTSTITRSVGSPTTNPGKAAN